MGRNMETTINVGLRMNLRISLSMMASVRFISIRP